MAIDNVGGTNVVDSIFGSSGNSQGSRRPSFTKKIVNNFNYFYKTVTKFVESPGVNNVSDFIFDNMSYVVDLVSDFFSSFVTKKKKKRAPRSVDNSNQTTLFKQRNMIKLKYFDSNLIISFDNSSTSRQVKFQFPISKSNILQYLLVPALMMTGVMPYILPPLKMGIMFVSMMTNMAFMTAVVSMVRGIIFDSDPSRHVVYPNYGYKKNRHKYYSRR